MNNHIVWKVVPLGLPNVVKNCSKCGNQSKFESSGNFRVNANQNSLDVWLIYQCSKCKTTWNMEIMSRVSCLTIDKELYQKYLHNDADLAEKYAFDASVHCRNKIAMSYEDMNYKIFGEFFRPEDLEEDVTIELLCDYPMELRLDKILSKQLGLSREAVKKMSRQGQISADGIKDICKEKLRSCIVISIKKPDAHTI
jgi:hypothetical protein